MPASYPVGFDSMSDPSSNLSGPPLHSTMHLQINDVLEAIEAELGINPSGTDATVAALLAALPARYAPVGSTKKFSANGGSAITSGVVELIGTALVIPDQGRAGKLTVWATMFITKTITTDTFTCYLRDGAVLIGIGHQDYGGAGWAQLTMQGEVAMVAGTGKTINLSVQRTGPGTGTATFPADATAHRVDALFVA